MSHLNLKIDRSIGYVCYSTKCVISNYLVENLLSRPETRTIYDFGLRLGLSLVGGEHLIYDVTCVSIRHKMLEQSLNLHGGKKLRHSKALDPTGHLLEYFHFSRLVTNSLEMSQEYRALARISEGLPTLD